jgi:CheY-like chemotaxis protein
MKKERVKILLVEDDENDIDLTITTLMENRLCNKVDIAKNGEEALDYLYRREKFKLRDETDPVLILLDLKMPKVDGLEVLRQIKADEQLKLLPVVVLTSSREEKDLVESYKLGVNAYVVKPVNFQQFSDAIKEIGLFWLVTNEPPPI